MNLPVHLLYSLIGENLSFCNKKIAEFCDEQIAQHKISKDQAKVIMKEARFSLVLGLI